MEYGTKQSRRDFLKHASKTSVAVAVGGLALAGCGVQSTTQDFKASSKKKKETLYRSTKAWNSYYTSAK